MAVFKCKMCGGNLNIPDGVTTGECVYCGTKQTLPRLDDDRRVNLYDRANHFRRNNDFDKAAGIYEQILSEDNTDAEAYWSLVLCRYGIEYVEDPATHRRVPTVNRTQFTSVYDDDNYKSALEHADAYQRTIYEEEAKTINEIQKGILDISQKEAPFDVFICYKETDNHGQRTPDSVLANDLYHQLTQEGFKVFFSRITLEDKLGTAYEPYIFAALNSATVMVVLGTKPEHFNSVWVKNEWSRYLSIVGQSGGKKVLIPAYKDMDPYDLPEEFSHLQAQDMSKLGFMQDLIRGIRKIIGSETDKRQQNDYIVQQGMSGNVSALLKRGYMALEDREWKKADEFFEEVLNQDAENAESYLGKWLAKENCSRLSGLVDLYNDKHINVESEKIKGCELASEHIESKVNEYTLGMLLSADSIRELYSFKTTYNSVLRNRKAQKEEILSELNSERLYIRAKQYAKAETKDALDNAIDSIIAVYDQRISQAQEDDSKRISEIKDSYAKHIEEVDKKVKELYDNAIIQCENIYQTCIDGFNHANEVKDYEKVKTSLERISDYKDAKEYISKCVEYISEINRKKYEADKLERARQLELLQQKKRARRKKTIIITAVAVSCMAVLIAGYFVFWHIIPGVRYDAATKLYNDGQYEEAAEIYSKLDYKNSQEMADSANRIIAKNQELDKKYHNSITKAKELSKKGHYGGVLDIIKGISGEEYKAYSNETDEVIVELEKEMLRTDSLDYIDEVDALISNSTVLKNDSYIQEMLKSYEAYESIVKIGSIDSSSKLSKVERYMDDIKRDVRNSKQLKKVMSKYKGYVGYYRGKGKAKRNSLRVSIDRLSDNDENEWVCYIKPSGENLFCMLVYPKLKSKPESMWDHSVYLLKDGNCIVKKTYIRKEGQSANSGFKYLGTTYYGKK